MKPYCMISNAKTFAFSAENPTGARAGGSKGGDCTKLSPTVAIRAGETVTLVDTVLGQLRISFRGSAHFRIFRNRIR